MLSKKLETPNSDSADSRSSAHGGSADRKVYALNAKDGCGRWAFRYGFIKT
jgi:hypothetical protein